MVDWSGRRSGVLLGIREYEEIVRRVQELKDALDLFESIRTAQGSRDCQETRQELKSEGHL